MSDTEEDAADSASLSIGALSRATGIPIGTLRSWELRYGFPEPLRRESGHRRYGHDQVDRLGLVKRALELGHRPSAVVAATPASLERLLAVSSVEPAAAALEAHPERLMVATLALDGASLDAALRHAIDDLGLRRFVHECVVPFLGAVGEAWLAGRLGVMHEHFASDRLKALLEERRRGRMGIHAVVCATLTGEPHDLGLHIAALLLAFGGKRVIFLGANTPVEDIAAAAHQCQAQAVLVGSSTAAPSEVVVPQLAALGRVLAPHVSIGVGGTAAAPTGVTLLADFKSLERWSAALD